MCCDGTLYSYVTLLGEDEVEALKRHDPSLAILMRSEQHTFDQPCPLHNGTGCTAYASRPDTCSRYYCVLLRSVATDDLTEHEALAIIQEAKALVENVKEYTWFEPGRPIAASTWLRLSATASPESRLAWDRATRWLRQHFLGPDREEEAEARVAAEAEAEARAALELEATSVSTE